MIRSAAILLLFLTTIFCGDKLFAAEIIDVVINPLNRAVIRFDSIPPKIDSKLSDDKTKISLSIGKYKFGDNIKQKSGLGIISDVFITKSDSGAIINIKSKEKRGYTIAYYPFTSSISVDVFSWDKLSIEEELYRTGLLANEDKIYSESLKNMYNSARKGYTPSYFSLGLIYLRMKAYKQATTILSNAIKNDSTNIDAIGALAIAYLNLGDSTKSNFFLNEFKQKCNCTVQSFNYDIIPEITDSTLFDVSFVPEIDLMALLNSSKSDTIIAIKKVDVAKTTKSEPNKSGNRTWKFITDYYQYIFFVIGAIGLLVLYNYLKWRNQKLLSLKINRQSDFQEELKTATNTIAPQSALNVYKKSEVNGIDDTKDELEGIEPQVYENPINDEKINKLGSIIESITGKSVDSYRNNPASNVNAKLQLAMHLADEQRKIKTQNLENLKTSTIPSDKKKLSEVSKKLGIEKGGLETKLALEKILKDKDKLRKLSDKFGS